MAIHIGRREFVVTLCSAAAWPLSVRAQAERVRRIGVLMGYAESDSDAKAWYAAFREGLQKLGWTEGHNTQIDTRWATPDVGCEASQRNSSRYGPTSCFRAPRPPRAHCFNKRTPSRLYSRSLPIQSAAASSRTSRGLAATSPVLSLLSRRWPASGWNCSRRLHRALPGLRCCSTRYRRHMPTI